MGEKIWNSRENKTKAFTMLEISLALFMIVAIAMFGKRLVNIAENNSKAAEESRIVDKNLNTLLVNVREDLENMVLLSKNQPIFEIRDGENGSFSMFFFATNGENHTTEALRYDVAALDFGKMEVSRTALDGRATLELQRAFGSGTSFGKFFDGVDQSNKSTRKFAIELSDFKVRATVKIGDDRIIQLNPNTNTVYTPGKIFYEKSGRRLTANGRILCFDVTARALLSNDAAKLRTLVQKKPTEAKEFLFTHSRKSFGKIMCNASGF
jgi:hypothetical protein